ncbi:MAG TPA: hypothetical protein VG125_12370 [Pirellulales bacterium]|jgi:hypothetical protein|nr:hypothetical protein [Pirellulales bacterium]
MKNRSESDSSRVARVLLSPLGIGLVSFAALTLLNLPALHDPPTWDGAMGVHPAAITLSRSGFDLAALLREPTYMQGGPNTHSMSLVTWLTSVFYRLLAGSDWLFPAMHVCHFALASIALTGVYRFARPAVGDLLAAALCAVVAFNPIVLAQSGCLYLEIPLLATTMAALVSWSNRSWKAAVCWSLVTFYIKETGLILAGTLGAAALIEAGSWRLRIGRAFGVVVPSIAAFCLNAAVAHPTGATPYVPPPYLEYLRFNIVQRLAPVPDLCVAMLLFFLVTALRSRAIWRGLRDPAGTGDTSDRRVMSTAVALSHLMVLAFTGFFLAARFVGEVYLLPRYFVQIFPCLALALIDAARRIAPERVVRAGAIVCCLLFLANREGTFYAPIDTNDGSVAERSLEYRDLLQVQRQSLRELESAAPEALVFYGLPEHFRVSYPEMGFVSRRPAQGHCILLDPPYNRARLADFPHWFYLVLDYPALGGQRLFAVFQEASRRGWNVRKASDFRRGHYRVLLLEIATPTANKPPTIGEEGRSAP